MRSKIVNTDRKLETDLSNLSISAINIKTLIAKHY